MGAIRVLFDGWSLVHNPLGSAAWHLRTLLALSPEGVQPTLALPMEPSASNAIAGIETIHHHTHERGEWEQRLLPRLAEERGAKVIHTTSLGASLLGKVPTLVSPAETEIAGRGRLGEALGYGGLARAKILWPEDVPKGKVPGESSTLPPVVHPEFFLGKANVPRSLDLPDEFLLVHGLHDQKETLNLLESWTWASASIGELYPLLIVGLDEAGREFIKARLPEYHVQESVFVIGDIQAQDLPSLYRACTALVHLGIPAPWGNPLRHALAGGKAIVAHQEANTESIVSSAAYLISPGDLRGFGAAMITVVVDEKARQKLEESAQERAAHWPAAKFRNELLKIYEG